MSKRKKNRYKKRKAKFNSERDKIIEDPVSDDIKESSIKNEPQLTTPTSVSRLSCYVTPKMSPLRSQNYPDPPQFSDIEAQLDHENFLCRKSINTSKFYSCHDNFLESDQHFQITLEKKIKRCNETPKCTRTRQHQNFLYDSPAPLKRKQKFSRGNCGDLSFSPNQFSSTPILQHQIKTIENNAERSFDVVKDDVVSPKTPIYNRNINLNNSYTTEKLLPKDSSMKNLKLHVINMSGKIKLPSTRQEEKFNFSRNISKKSFNVSISNTETTRFFFGNLKRYYKIVYNWIIRIWEICSNLGTNLKKDTVDGGEGIADPFHGMCDKCLQCKENISILSKKIEELTVLQSGHLEQMKTLSQQLHQIKQQVDKLNDFQTELEMLKEQVKMAKPASLVPSVLPPAPPPPPPPLPPPVLPLSETKTFNFQKKSSSGTKAVTNENLRPVISLEDILKVKLKKTSSRLHQPISRRNSSAVPSDMLKAVTLKPVPRTPHLLSTPKNDIGDMTLSPNTRLCSLLKTEMSTSKIKRLQRVGKYSFDSIYKKRLLDSRDRE
ncbi:uncharacterized protein LOC130444838 [Diorhabda sublineata]|uniref:uncharacterized protein LOC130444838 n=1 Tax=Diorhabda sublineata TaxID=1163346 RepID=UPI0024E08B2E|nr:uncharacterized protein LOC130444838 [Diorhabda sublineata]